MEEVTSRREFLRGIGCSAIWLMAMGITITSCDSTEVAGPDPGDPGPGGDTGITVNANTIVLDLSKSGAAVLNSAGGFLNITAGGAMAINDNGTIRAFTNVCTHEQCTTSWSFGSQRLTCGCHGSQFSVSGQVLVGPAASPLKTLNVTRAGSIVTIARS